MIYVRTANPPVSRHGVQNVGGWMDFVGPILGIGLQVGGSLITAKLLPKTPTQAPVTQVPAAQAPAGNGQWINGVSNGVVLAGGAVLLVGILFATRR